MSKNIENAKYKIIVEPDAWASINQSVGEDYKKVRYAKLPIQSLNPLMYKYEKLYSEHKVIGLLKAYYHDGYTEGLTLQEQEIQTLRAKVASAELLVDALKNSIQFISGSVRIESNSFDEPPSPVSEWDYQADMLALELNEALESYKKLSEVEHD